MIWKKATKQKRKKKPKTNWIFRYQITQKEEEKVKQKEEKEKWRIKAETLREVDATDNKSITSNNIYDIILIIVLY